MDRVLNREIMCDKCMQNDPNEEYSEPLNYDAENGDFICSKGHREDRYRYFEFDSKHDLIETIMDLLKERSVK